MTKSVKAECIVMLVYLDTVVEYGVMKTALYGVL